MIIEPPLTPSPQVANVTVALRRQQLTYTVSFALVMARSNASVEVELPFPNIEYSMLGLFVLDKSVSVTRLYKAQ